MACAATRTSAPATTTGYVGAYTDFGLFDDPEMLDDISDLFNYLTGYSKRREYRQLLVAPVSLRSSILALLDRELSTRARGCRRT